MPTHTTVSGHAIEYDTPAPDVLALLARLRAMLEDPKAREDDMLVAVYSPDNPIMDRSVMPGRGAVTPAVLADPVYQVMADLLFRKRIQEHRVDVEKLAAQHTLTVAEAAARLGINESALRKAIAARRLGTWLKDGRHYIDPRALASFHLQPRGPQPAEGHASTVPLEVRYGAAGGKALKVKHPGELVGSEMKTSPDGRMYTGTISPWKRVAVFAAEGGKARMFILEPGEEREEFVFGELYVRGNFRIVEKINNARKADEAWKAFEAG